MTGLNYANSIFITRNLIYAHHETIREFSGWAMQGIGIVPYFIHIKPVTQFQTENNRKSAVRINNDYVE